MHTYPLCCAVTSLRVARSPVLLKERETLIKGTYTPRSILFAPGRHHAVLGG